MILDIIYLYVVDNDEYNIRLLITRGNSVRELDAGEINCNYCHVWVTIIALMRFFP